MSIFIKAGLWASKKLGYKGELNLTQLIESLIPASTQVNSDWNATSGVAEILNKPNIPATGYKVFIALLNQSGTNPPVPTVLENGLTTGVLTYARVSTGVYTISYSLGALTPTNCLIYFPKNSISANVTYDSGSIRIVNSGPPADGYLINNILDIKIFI
jgi:hypothetical protein